MTLHELLFWCVALLTSLCAVAVVLTQNIVRAAVWLLFTLAGTAGLFFLLGADFIGATQLLVYVGGVLVLVIFGVMLTAQGPFISLKAGAGEWAIALVVGLLLYGLIAGTVFLTDWPLQQKFDDPAASRSSNDVGLSLLGITRAARSYLLPFEIVSVHLLVVLIGAAYLARAKRRQGVRTP
jgi:NADH-quinone oxidoreductase subunit J